MKFVIGEFYKLREDKTKAYKRLWSANEEFVKTVGNTPFCVMNIGPINDVTSIKTITGAKPEAVLIFNSEAKYFVRVPDWSQEVFTEGKSYRLKDAKGFAAENVHNIDIVAAIGETTFKVLTTSDEGDILLMRLGTTEYGEKYNVPIFVEERKYFEEV